MTTHTPGSGPIFTVERRNLEEAIEHFAYMKQLSRKKFLKIFLVTEIKNKI